MACGGQWEGEMWKTGREEAEEERVEEEESFRRPAHLGSPVQSLPRVCECASRCVRIPGNPGRRVCR